MLGHLRLEVVDGEALLPVAHVLRGAGRAHRVLVECLDERLDFPIVELHAVLLHARLHHVSQLGLLEEAVVWDVTTINLKQYANIFSRSK